jgi:magnesium chelatase family protein
MLAALRSAAVLGIDAFDVLVETDVALGLPQWTIVGLPTGAVKESRQRVNAALANSGLPLPQRRITVNLSPADVPKSGTAFDLPIALGLLVATGAIAEKSVANLAAVGELGLDGTLRGIRGSLSIARRVAATGGTLVLPQRNVAEARLAGGVRLCAPANIAELVQWLRDGELPEPESPAVPRLAGHAVDFAEVVGQRQAKRALEIAAAGGHACLLVGPPGAGKTMLARRVPTILPAMEEEETLEVTAIHSVAGLIDDAGVVCARPFRAPHHSVSTAGLIGGGGLPRPGEVSLAHNGVLFLDELFEFPRNALEALRQPLEDGRVVIARAAASVSFPARFALIGAANPCPCGYAGDRRRACRCAESEIVRYRSRLSGPLADRIDIHLTLSSVSLSTLAAESATEAGIGKDLVEDSATIRSRVEAARAIQRDRARVTGAARSNAQLQGRWLRGSLAPSANTVLNRAAERLHLSARSFHRVMRVARTIADLAASERIEEAHVAESLRYRPPADSSVPPELAAAM